MEDETGASGSSGKKPAQRRARKSEEAAPGGEISSRGLADDERADPGQPVSDPAAPGPEPAALEPDAEGLERLRNRLMAKYHGRRR